MAKKIETQQNKVDTGKVEGDKFVILH